MATTYDLFHASQIRQCEQTAMTALGITPRQLMTSAGSAAFSTLKQLFPKVKKIMIYCGGGNNAGDGYELARLAYTAGYSVIINQYTHHEQLPQPAKDVADAALQTDIQCVWMEDIIDNDIDLIIDALLGIGLKAAVKEPIASAITQINESHLPVLSLDIPSGLDANTGHIMGVCVRATATITFIGKKRGMVTLEGPEHCGEVLCNDLGISSCLNKLLPAAHLLEKHFSLPSMSHRPVNCHKGDFGHVLVIGGDAGMPGAVVLAAHAALRTGAGVVTIATKPEYAKQSIAGLPEVMIYGIEEVGQLAPLIKKSTVCVIGPGLGLNEWGSQLFTQVIAAQVPMIIDASALRILAKSPQHDDNWILTPHPGEAADLLACSTLEIQSDRFKAISQLQKKYGGNIVLKGIGSLVYTDAQTTFVCKAGNPGMASAGMGDVLSGVIAGLVAQKLSLADAAKLGVWLHATAGDRAALKNGERGLIASDLMPYLHQLVNE